MRNLKGQKKWSAGPILLRRSVFSSDGSLARNLSLRTGIFLLAVFAVLLLSAPAFAGNTYFADSFENGLSKWEVSGSDWALIDTDSRSTTHSVTDSPTGNYDNNANTSITLAGPIDLSSSTSPVLTFWHKYATESNYDRGRVEISQDGGFTWTGIKDYSGGSTTWSLDQIDLSSYKSSPIKIRFRLTSDSSDTNDGWYIDDVEIKEEDTAIIAYPFFDNFENGLGNWLASGQDWSLITTAYRSVGHAVTDSPSGNYPDSANASLTLKNSIDLSSSTSPVLTFWHKYATESNYDRGRVEISQDGGFTWTGIKDYSGGSTTWSLDQIDLSSYKSSPIKIRFRLTSDSSDTNDGWYIDDVVIKELGTAPTFYTLNVDVSPDGAGIVTSSPGGIDCGSDCAESYDANRIVTLTAEPGLGATFTGWAGGCLNISGNVCTVKMTAAKSVTASFTIDTSNQAYTAMSLDLSSQTILQDETIDAMGKLTRLPDNGSDLSDQTIVLTITGPTGTSTTETTKTYDTYGHYIFTGISGFAQKGKYTIRASFAGTSLLASSESEAKTVLAGSAAGYAILIEGKVPGEEGLDSHNKTAKRIYQTLLDRGFIDENIYYFNYDATQPEVDELPSEAGAQWAIETWAKDKLNGVAAPLYILMVDHGNPDAFIIDNETITPAELSAWLGSLETGLNTTAKKEKRIAIIGACYSGSFIPELSKPGRVIITSAAEDEESYKGPNEPDGIRSGEFFLEELFKDFAKGYSIRDSFDDAADKTSVFTRKGGKANSAPPFFDNSMQHPLLDDNGDQEGTNMLTDEGDGLVSAGLYLGVGLTRDTNSPDNPADITEVTPAKYLSDTATSGLLWAKANNDADVSAAWLEIRPPSKRLTSTGGSGQLELSIPKSLLKFNSSAKRWEKTYVSFTESGMYEIFYYVRDAITGDISPMQRSLVYKNKDGNTAPSDFNLLYPANGSVQKTVLLLSWEDSSDSDGLTYTLLISRQPDPTIFNSDYVLEEVPGSMAAIGPEAGLEDGAGMDETHPPYYWKVIAVDSYGARTYSNVRSFKTNNTNPELPGFIEGMITDKATGAAVKSPAITVSKGIVKIKGSIYEVYGKPGEVILTVNAPGYAQTEITSRIKSGETTRVNIALADNTAPQTRITSGPSNPTTSKSATFSFKSSEAGSKFKCRLDGSAYALCTSPKTYNNLAEGSHIFRVKAIDAIGNMDATPAKYSWTIDLTP